MENDQITQDEWVAFFKKGYDENGKAQYLDMTDPVLEKSRIQFEAMTFSDLERVQYENQQMAILDHNSEVYEMESKWKEIEDEKQELATERAQFETEKLAFVKRLLQIKASNELISVVTGISKEQMERLHKEM